MYVADPGVDGLVGREAEVELFAGMFADLRLGRGQSVLIEGEPGIGKTALLESVVAQARASGFDVVRGGYDGPELRGPVWVLYGALGLPVIPAQSRRHVDGATDPLLVGVERVLSLVHERSARGPLVLAVEDLHRADEASMLLWRRLCRIATSLPLLLLSTCRSGTRRREIDLLRASVRAQRGEVLTLTGLNGEAVAELTRLLLGLAPGPRLTEQIEMVGGNPLGLKKLLEGLARDGGVAFGSTTAELVDSRGPGDAGEQPEAGASVAPDDGLSIARAVDARLNHLGEDTRQLLRMAVLLGPDFVVADLSSVLGRPARALAAPVGEAIAAGMLESSGARLRFRYGLLRESLYESTPGPARARMRREAARALRTVGAPIERVATLFLGAVSAGEDWVDEAWAVAWIAENASALGWKVPGAAAELFQHMLAHSSVDGPERALLLDELAGVCFSLARYERAVEVGREISATTGDPERIGRAGWIEAGALARMGRTREAERVIEGLSAGPRLSAVWRGRLTALSAVTAFLAGEYERAGAVARQAVAEGEHLSDAVALGYSLYVEASLRFRAADLAGCADLLVRALISIEAEPRLGDLRTLLHVRQAEALAGLDRFAEAQAVVRTDRPLGGRGDPPHQAAYALSVAQLTFHQGRWDEALAALGEDADGDDGEPTWLPKSSALGHGIIALIAAHREDPVSARLHIEAASAKVGQTESARLGSCYTMLADAVLAERDGRPEQALARLVPLLDAEYVGTEIRTLALPVLVRVALETGDRRSAESAVRWAESSVPAAAPQALVSAARWCRGLLESDPLLLAGVVADMRAAGRRFALAQVLEDAVVVRSRAGDGGGPRDELAEVLGIYDGLGATWVARRAVGRLRSLGVRTSGSSARRPGTGRSALTATESRVADLVVLGLSSPEVAERLSLSRRTVETHVAHIMAKLGVRSRREIAGVLLAGPPD